MFYSEQPLLNTKPNSNKPNKPSLRVGTCQIGTSPTKYLKTFTTRCSLFELVLFGLGEGAE